MIQWCQKYICWGFFWNWGNTWIHSICNAGPLKWCDQGSLLPTTSSADLWSAISKKNLLRVKAIHHGPKTTSNDNNGCWCSIRHIKHAFFGKIQHVLKKASCRATNKFKWRQNGCICPECCNLLLLVFRAWNCYNMNMLLSFVILGISYYLILKHFIVTSSLLL